MDKDSIRARFKHYRQQIAELNEQLSTSSYYAEEAESRRMRRDRAYENERIERERQAEADRWYREEELRKVTSDIERARSYGDEWEESRAIERLKKLNY